MDPPDSYMEVEEGSDTNHSSGMSEHDYCPISAATSFVASAFFSHDTISQPQFVVPKGAQPPLQQYQTVKVAALAMPMGMGDGKEPCSCGGFKITLPETDASSIKSDTLSVQRASAKLGLETLGSELICAICQQLFVEASTIECGHSFCRMCIENWLKSKLSCPICRHPLQKPPVTSLCLDKAVKAMLEIAQEQETAQELMERKKIATKARESECFAQTCLETLFQKAVQQGVKVVHISKQWSPREQQRFLDGIERHQGVAREAYCKVVGLTYEWVGRATKEELLIAAQNVMLRDMEHKPKTQTEWKEGCSAKLRSRLEMYIRYG